MKKISIDMNAAPVDYDRSLFNCIGSCHAYLALREDYRQHFRQIQKEIGFHYLRFHGIFLDWVGIYNEDEQGNVFYNFQNYDKIMDFILETECRPFLELSFMPEALASGTSSVFKYKGNITPPEDMGKWNDLIRATVLHSVEKYGKEELKCWYFEVWNEPNLKGFWSGSKEEYFNLYKNTAETIKSICPEFRVGGPSSAGKEWIKETVEFCRKDKVPLDFISTHNYATEALLDVQGAYKRGFAPRHSLGQWVRKSVEEADGIPVHYTEWNSTPSHPDVYGKDSEFTPAFVLDTVKDIRGLVGSFSFWTFTDIFEESGPGKGPFSGKYGLVNLHGIKKPVYHAFHFLSMMYDQEITVDEEGVRVTRSAEGHIRCLVWNCPEVLEPDFKGGEWKLDKDSFRSVLVLKGLNGTYTMKKFLIDRTHSNSFRAWQDMGSPEYLTNDQVDDLKKKGEPECVFQKDIQADGSFSFSIGLHGPAFIFLDFLKLSE